MPPLRARKEDIPLLVTIISAAFLARQRETGCSISPTDAMNALLAYDWPGNVRELRTAIEHGVVMATGPKVTVRRFAARDPGGGGNVRQRNHSFGNGESARPGGNRKTADHPGAQFNGRKHNRRGQATGDQPPDLAPQAKRVECAGAECAGASARRKETHKINHAGRRRFHSENRPYLRGRQECGLGKALAGPSLRVYECHIETLN